MNPQEIVEKVKAAGVVGAGGAGFPTHIKLGCTAAAAIANGVECEPLLEHDRHIMMTNPEKVLQGLDLLAQAVGAKRKIIALKKKYREVQNLLANAGNGFDFILMDDYYPAGDEVEIVKADLNTTVPEAGIPLDIGAVVNNIETLTNIVDAVEGEPVTRRTLTVCGEVENPALVRAPIGTSVKDIIDHCGGAKINDFAVYIGGPMMGEIVDPSSPVTKTTTGIFILPQEHFLIQVRSTRMEHILRQAQAACTDCKMCTEVCPRYLLGHDIEPHKIMRTVSLQLEGRHRELMSAFLCCFCGACEYACPMWLSPRRVYRQTREYLLEEGAEFPRNERILQDNPNRNFRRIPSPRLLSRLGLSKYNVPKKFLIDVAPAEVVIPLKQHIGYPAMSIVESGDRVSQGEVIAEIPEGRQSARIHASIDGKITKITDKTITVKAG